jgi:hypothetical protein
MRQQAFSLAVIVPVPYSIAVSQLRCPFLSDFFIAVRLLSRREKFTERVAQRCPRASGRIPLRLFCYYCGPSAGHAIGTCRLGTSSRVSNGHRLVSCPEKEPQALSHARTCRMFEIRT